MIFSLSHFAYADDGAENFSKTHADFFHLLHPQKSEIELAYSVEPQRGEDGGPGEFDLNDFSAKLDIPTPLSADTYLSNGLGFQAKVYDFKAVPSITETSSNTLYKGVLQSGIGHFVTEDFLLEAKTWFGFYSDLDGGIDDNALHLYGDGEGVYRLNPYTQVLAGVRYSEDFDDTPLFPLVGFRLATTEGKLLFSVTAPLEASVTYNLDEKSLLYVGGWISGDEYRMTAGPLGREFNVQVYDQRIGAGYSYWFGKHFKINVEAGALVGSEFEFKTLDAGQFNGDMEPGAYGTLRLGWGL